MRLLAGTRPDRPLTLAEHLAVHGALPRTGRGLVDEVEAEAASDVADRKDKLDQDIDAMLDEIDDVLEENSEDFVRSFIQKGGQ